MKIAVIDSGITPTLGEFNGRIDPASADMAADRAMADEWGHGTAVAAVAAAAKNDSAIHGVAFQSSIVALKVDEPGTCANGNCVYGYSAITAALDAARLAGAKVINMSIVGSTPSQELLDAIGRAVSAGILVVICAGNDAQANPALFASVPASQYPGMIMIAGSIGVDNGSGGTDLNQISTFSNRAGTDAASYLAALGYNVNTVGADGSQQQWWGTSFAAPTISGAAALLFQAFPNLTANDVMEILFGSADDLGAAGVDSVFGHGRLNIARAFEPMGTTALAGSSVPVDLGSNGDLPPAAGDGGTGGSFGAVILDGYSRAFVLNLAATLRQAQQDKPLARAIQNRTRSTAVAAGPITLAMTISERRDMPQGFALESMGIGPEDARKSRLIAGAAIARLDDKTAAAFGFAEGAKVMERRLSGAEPGAFLIAKDIAGDPGFAAKREGSVAIRRNLGPVGLTVSGESGSVWTEVRTSVSDSPYRWTSVALDKDFGSTWLSAGLSRLEEKQTLLGGRMGNALGGGGSNSLFLDLEARRQLGRGLSAGLTARRGWTSFAGGKMQTDAYAFDVTKSGLLNSSDRIGLRIAQPLRVSRGGFGMLLPTAYDYSTQTATTSWTTYSITPSGREIDAELSYGSSLWEGGGWVGGNLFLRRQPGHIATADNDYGAAIRFTLGL